MGSAPKKDCPRCEQTFETSIGFRKDKTRKDGLCFYCKECESKFPSRAKEAILAATKKWTKANWERVRQYRKDYYQKNKEKLKEQQKEYYQANLEKIRDQQRANYHRKKNESEQRTR